MRGLRALKPQPSWILVAISFHQVITVYGIGKFRSSASNTFANQSGMTETRNRIVWHEISPCSREVGARWPREKAGRAVGQVSKNKSAVSSAMIAVTIRRNFFESTATRKVSQ